MPKLYEFRMPRRVYPDAALCYTRQGNSIQCYDDSTTPRRLIATAFWGDAGWTYEGEVNAERDKFLSLKQAAAAAFYKYEGVKALAIQK